jgi:type VI secretion system protein ImpG
VASDFTWEVGAPLEAVQCVTGPTPPRPSWAEGDSSWRLISHLCLNYLSLSDTDDRAGAQALRELLQLYADRSEPLLRRQVEQGVRFVSTGPVTRRVPGPGPITFARGLEVSLVMDELAFEGSGVFLLGAVLERFFARYVSINSFTETVLKTPERGEVMRWPARMGRRNVL